MSKRQIKRIFPGITFQNRKFNNLKEELLKENDCCVVCRSKTGLEPHHIIPCNVYDKLFFKKDNIAIICKTCHNIYHQNYVPTNQETFDEFKDNYTLSKSLKKKLRGKTRKYKRKEYEPHPLYSKIRINDFTKTKKKSKRKKRRKKAKKRLKRINPIYLLKNIGSDEWNYPDKIQIEKEVLGDYCEN